MKYYRKVYIRYYGPIPVDEAGRSYEIHHIDGNHSNNHPSNLKAVSIQEHYDIHLSQGDYGACLLISNRLNIDPKEKSVVASKNASGRKCITNGSIDKRISIEEEIPEGWWLGKTNGKVYGPRSDEFKSKMSSIKKGKPLSLEHRESLKGVVRGMTGKSHSAETKLKMSLALKGKPKSESHKLNLRLAKRRKKNVDSSSN